MIQTLSQQKITELLSAEEYEVKLLQLLSEKTVTPAQAAQLFQQLKIENIGLENVTYLYHLCQRTAFKGVPTQVLPRIRGVSRFWIAHNARLFMQAFALIKQFNDHHIDILLCKGIAVKLGYAPHISRAMWDVDLTVAAADFATALQLAKNEGYQGKITEHSADLKKGKDIFIDLHYVFNKTAIMDQAIERPIWQRSTLKVFYGQKVYVPCAEDVMVQLLANAAGDIYKPVPVKSKKLKWLNDFLNITAENDLDWDKVVRYAKEQHIEHLVYLSLEIITGLFTSCRFLRPYMKGLLSDKGSCYNYRQVLRLRQVALAYFAERDTSSWLQIIWPWLKFHWYSNCLYAHAETRYGDMRALPDYLKKYWQCPYLSMVPFKIIQKLIRRQKYGPDHD